MLLSHAFGNLENYLRVNWSKNNLCRVRNKRFVNENWCQNHEAHCKGACQLCNLSDFQMVLLGTVVNNFLCLFMRSRTNDTFVACY